MRKNLWTQCVVLMVAIVAACAVFAPTQHFNFLDYDDGPNIFGNETVTEHDMKSLQQIWSAPTRHLYIPMTYSVWGGLAALDEAITGIKSSAETLRPVFFHTANYVLHGINAALVWQLLVLLGFEGWLALFGAGMFLWHPLQVEPVAWAMGMKDILSGFLALLAAVLWLQSFRTCAALQSTRLKTLWRQPRYWIAVALFALAMLAKPSVASFPLAVGLLAYFFLRIPGRMVGFSVVPFLCCAIPPAIITKLSQPDNEIIGITPFWARPFIAADAMLFYVKKVFLPWPLLTDYSRSPEKVMSDWRGLFAGYLSLILLILVWVRRRLLGVIAVGIGFMFLTLIPVLGWVNFNFQKMSTVADRYMYLALLGPVLILLTLLKRLGRKPAMAIGVGILSACVFLTYRQLPIWADDEPLWQHVLRFNSASAVAHNNLGARINSVTRADEAFGHFLEAVRLQPDYGIAHYNLGLEYQKRHDNELAQQHLKMAMKYLPNLPIQRQPVPQYQAQQDMREAEQYLTNKQPMAAIPLLLRVLAQRPQDADVLATIGAAYGMLGHIDDAERYVKQALTIAPQHQGARQNWERIQRMKHAQE